MEVASHHRFQALACLTSPLVRGTTLVRVLSGHRVTVARAVEVAAQPDGAPVALSAERRAQRDYVFTRPAGSSNGLNLEGPVVIARPAAGTTGTVSIRLLSKAVPAS